MALISGRPTTLLQTHSVFLINFQLDYLRIKFIFDLNFKAIYSTVARVQKNYVLFLRSCLEFFISKFKSSRIKDYSSNLIVYVIKCILFIYLINLFNTILRTVIYKSKYMIVFFCQTKMIEYDNNLEIAYNKKILNF